MKKVFWFLCGAAFYTANALAAGDVVISRAIPTKITNDNVESVDNSRDKKDVQNARSTRRVVTNSDAVKNNATRSVVTRNTQKTNVVSRNKETKNIISRSPNNQKTTNARSTLSDGVNTFGRSNRTDAASINNTGAVRRAGVVLRTSTAEVGGRATIGNTDIQTGSNIDEQIKGKRSRAAVFGSNKTTTNLTAESISAAKDILEKTADLNSTCQQQYNECMDQFCMVVDSNQKRCSCSANLAKYEKAQKAVEQANSELNDVAQNIRYIGLSANEIRAIMSATEAEEAMSKTKDNTENRSLLDDIAAMIEDPSVATAGLSGTDSGSILDFDFSGDSGDTFSLDLFNNSKDISNKRGRDLYKEATKRCKSVLNACKDAGGTETQITGNYDLAIDKDCIAYEQGLKKLNDTLLANVRSANLMLQKARLTVLQNKNQYDIKGCVGALEECMLDDMVCGADYKKCLDPTKKFIDESGNVILGRDITNITAFMQNYDNSKITADFIKNSSSDVTCSDGDGKCIVNYLMKKIGTGATVQDGGLCRAVLDKCQNFTYMKSGKKSSYNPYNDVVVNYIQRAMVNIRSAESKIISEYASNCMADVSECYNDQYSQISSWATSANAVSVYDIMVGSCYNVALTCGYAVFAYDQTMGKKIDAIKNDNVTYPTDEAKTKAQNDTLIGGISELFAQEMICPENSTFVAESHEPSVSRTMSVDRTVYKNCATYGECQAKSSLLCAMFTNRGKDSCESHLGCLWGVVPFDGGNNYECRNGSFERTHICLRKDKESCTEHCEWHALESFLGTDDWTKKSGENVGGIAYVNAHCKCNRDHIVWNGACVKACGQNEIRNASGKCQSCAAGEHPVGGDIAYEDWRDCNSTIITTEPTRCEADTVTQ